MGRLLERKMNVLAKERALVPVRDGDFVGLERLFDNLYRKRPFYAPVPLQGIRDLANYQWADASKKKVAFDNFACACVAIAEGMDAQIEPRFNKVLETYDTDRVDKNLGLVRQVHSGAKVFTATGTVNSPMVKGKDFIWVGKRVRGVGRLERPDELIPVDVMKRVYDIRNSGVEFDDYFMFLPATSYERSKLDVASSEIQKLGDDARSLVRGAKEAAMSALDAGIWVSRKVAAGARSTVDTISDAGQWMSHNLNERARMAPARVTEFKDPVLTGVINGSLAEKRYFFIEIGRWVDTF